MNHSLTVELSAESYLALERQAAAAGLSPGHLASASLERQFKPADSVSEADGLERQAARERFEKHFGEVDLGEPTGSDNDGIDADLAGEYAKAHEEK